MRLLPFTLSLLVLCVAACDGPTSPREVDTSHPVAPTPPPDPFSPPPVGKSVSLVVDTFTVIETRVECAWDCPYLAYWPLLKLREPTGQRDVTVDAVEFTIPEMSTGPCRGEVVYAPGMSAFAVTFDPYLWSNDILLVRLDGRPVSGGRATARVHMHDSAGNSGVIEIKGEIQRMVQNPSIPRPGPAGPQAWGCQ